MMFVEYICLLLCCCALSSHCYKVKYQLCKDESCYYLYETGYYFLTWEKSYEACREQDLDMLRIDSNQTKLVVEDLVKNISMDTDRRVWIGARRNTDDTWRYMNGTEFKETVTSSSDTGLLNCLYVKLCENENPKYQADNCDEKTSTSRVVCEYLPNEQGQCTSPDSAFSGKCYRKTLFGGEANKIDWYSGETYCSKREIQGHIAYSYLDSGLDKSIRNLVGGNSQCVQLWFGVRRRIWTWPNASYHDGEPVKYFNWYNVSQTPLNDRCVYMDLNKNNKWLMANCNDVLKYFICMRVPRLSVVTNSDEENFTDLNVTFSMTKDESFPSAYVATGIICLIIFAVIGGLTVFFVWKKQKRRAQEHSYVNDNFTGLSPERQKNDDPEYEEINPDGHNQDNATAADDDDDVTSPDGITSTRKAASDINHKVAPSGDLYAVSSKQLNETGLTKNKDEDKVEALYAQPKKKRKPKLETQKSNIIKHSEARSVKMQNN